MKTKKIRLILKQDTSDVVDLLEIIINLTPLKQINH